LRELDREMTKENLVGLDESGYGEHPVRMLRIRIDED